LLASIHLYYIYVSYYKKVASSQKNIGISFHALGKEIPALIYAAAVIEKTAGFGYSFKRLAGVAEVADARDLKSEQDD